MFVRVLAALFASVFILAGEHALGLVYVTTGQYYESLLVSNDDFLMNGGRVDHLFLDNGNFRIVEGSLGNVDLHRGHFEIWGGTFDGDVTRTAASQIDLRGFHFRVDESAGPNEREMRVEGITVSHDFYQGIYVGFNIINESSLPSQFLTTQFYVYSQVNPLDNGLHNIGDLDQDYDIDLSDLNVARNCFGVTDICNGRRHPMDLEDLNNVRNFFHFFPYTLSESHSLPFTCTINLPCETGIAVPSSATAVPEPSTLALAFVGCMVLAVHYRRRA